MKLYMFPINGGDASAGPIELELLSQDLNGTGGKVVEIGDIVLGAFSLQSTGSPPYSGAALGEDLSGHFAAATIEDSLNPGQTPPRVSLVQNQVFGASGTVPRNISGVHIMLLMQRGTDIPATITVGPVDLRT